MTYVYVSLIILLFVEKRTRTSLETQCDTVWFEQEDTRIKWAAVELACEVRFGRIRPWKRADCASLFRYDPLGFALPILLSTPY